MGPIPNLDRFVLKELEMYSRNPHNDNFYHYTTIEALDSILTSSKIRFSDCKYLNDASEVNHGLNKVNNLLNNKISELSKLKNPKKYYEKRLCQLFDGMNPSNPNFPSHYIFCLCEKGDLLSQWRGYSKNSCPVGIKFKLNDIGKVSKCPRTYLYKVIYDEGKQDEIILKIIKDYLLLKYHDTIEEQGLFLRTKWALFFAAIFFKHPSFQEEQEWRFVHYCYPLHKDKREIRFVNKNLYLLPYVAFNFAELFPNSNGTPINEIIVGPQRNSLSVESIKEYLKTRGLSIHVNPSRIPYRI